MPSFGDGGISGEELGPELPSRDKAWGCKAQRLGIQVSSRTPHLYLLPEHGPDPSFPLLGSGFWVGVQSSPNPPGTAVLTLVTPTCGAFTKWGAKCYALKRGCQGEARPNPAWSPGESRCVSVPLWPAHVGGD